MKSSRLLMRISLKDSRRSLNGTASTQQPLKTVSRSSRMNYIRWNPAGCANYSVVCEVWGVILLLITCFFLYSNHTSTINISQTARLTAIVYQNLFARYRACTQTAVMAGKILLWKLRISSACGVAGSCPPQSNLQAWPTSAFTRLGCRNGLRMSGIY
jgi:hypothetical protein